MSEITKRRNVKMSAFSKWINEKFEEYRGARQGQGGSLSAFGRMLGAPHQTIQMWLKPDAKPPRKQEYINRLVELYGQEAYDAMGIDAPTLTDRGVQLAPEARRALEAMSTLPPEDRQELIEQIEAWLLENGFRRMK
jgi:hypothetical protein